MWEGKEGKRKGNCMRKGKKFKEGRSRSNCGKGTEGKGRRELHYKKKRLEGDQEGIVGREGRLRRRELQE